MIRQILGEINRPDRLYIKSLIKIHYSRWLKIFLFGFWGDLVSMFVWEERPLILVITIILSAGAHGQWIYKYNLLLGRLLSRNLHCEQTVDGNSTLEILKEIKQRKTSHISDWRELRIWVIFQIRCFSTSKYFYSLERRRVSAIVLCKATIRNSRKLTPLCQHLIKLICCNKWRNV